jgi:hypothetical protein
MGQHTLAREQLVKSLAIAEKSGQEERVSEFLGALANNDNEQGNPTRPRVTAPHCSPGILGRPLIQSSPAARCGSTQEQDRADH